MQRPLQVSGNYLALVHTELWFIRNSNQEKIKIVRDANKTQYVEDSVRGDLAARWCSSGEDCTLVSACESDEFIAARRQLV